MATDQIKTVVSNLQFKLEFQTHWNQSKIHICKGIRISTLDSKLQDLGVGVS